MKSFERFIVNFEHILHLFLVFLLLTLNKSMLVETCQSWITVRNPVQAQGLIKNWPLKILCLLHGYKFILAYDKTSLNLKSPITFAFDCS